MEEAVVESLVETIGEQKGLLSSVQKTLRNFKKDSVTRKTESYHQTRLDTLASYRTEFRENHRILIRQTKCPQVKQLYIDTSMEDTFEEAYLETVDVFRDSLSQIGAATKVAGDASNNSTANDTSCLANGVPLPTVPLPTFTGNFVEWPTFKDIFCDRVHDNKMLNNLQRFHYLKSALGGDAAQDIQHISVVGQNYPEAWKMLCDQFDNNRILFTHYMDVLFQQPDVPKNDPTALRHFTQTCRSCINSIGKLDVNISEQNQILVYLLIKKLPDNIRMEWERSLRKQTSIPTFSELCSLLDEQYIMMLSSQKTATDRQSTGQVKKYENTNRIKRDFKTMYTARNPTLCQCCLQSDHPVRECPKFQNMSLDEKRAEIEKLKLCYNCLGYNHISSKCSSQRKCAKCGGKHHTLIHVERNGDNLTANVTTVEAAIFHNSSQAPAVNHYDVLLPTAVITVRAASGQLCHFRALLDQCSQVTVISEKAAQHLGLPREKSAVCISGISGAVSTTGRFCVKLVVGSRYDKDVQLEVEAYILPKVCGVIPAKKVKPVPYKYFHGLQLADPNYFEPQSIDILLGNDIYDEVIMNDIRRVENGPIAQKTKFGYMVSGKNYIETHHSTPRMSYFTSTDHSEIDSLVKRFWEIETIVDPVVLSEEDSWCEEFFAKTHRRLDNGKYLVRLPLKTEIQSNNFIAKTRSAALKRFIHLENRLQREPELKKIYCDTINEYLQLGQMHPVKTTEEQHCFNSEKGQQLTCSYLPHHPVVKESAVSTKVRIVFDASAKSSNGKSLNDILATGPALQRDLSSILTNWRMFKYVFMTDIEKMFRCIDVDEEDAQYQRILWREEPGQPIQEFYCSTVMFGTASAPYTAIRTIHQLAQDEGHQYPRAAKVLKEQMYVDDILSGADTIDKALIIEQEVITMLKGAAFELRKWASNDIRLLKNIPLEHRHDKEALQLKASDTIKALGMYWEPSSDEFKFAINFEIMLQEITKRKILSTIARLFDPLGWLNPVIITAKILLQKLWALKRGWDVVVSADLQKEWEAYAKELPNISSIRVARWLNIDSNRNNCELHIFCDASKDAHAAVAYLRGLNQNNEYTVKLLQAKSKVNPIKPSLTIPRAELCGAVLATKLLKFLLSNLNIAFHGIFMWTDSSIVLYWIRGDPNRWKPFVSNRIHKILNSSETTQWRHIVSERNPADISSRGVSPSRLAGCSLWWEGPSFLKLPFNEWPKSDLNPDIMEVSIDSEKRKAKILLNVTNVSHDSYIYRFSSFSKLARVTAYCFRFYTNCKNKLRKRGCLTASELNWSTVCLVRMAQQDIFIDEWRALSRKKDVSNDSNLRSLNPFFDGTSKTIRLGGRLKNSLLPENQKHPHIVPAKHHITELLVNSSHLATLHGGVSLTLNHIRRQFWILNGRKTVRTVLHRCLPCFKNNPKHSVQLMGDLPAERVRPARAFTSTGIDYAGPFNILPSKGRGRTSFKGYIALFICLVTKAIHLELVGDLTADSFLGALNRFIGRRGLCTEIYSDCGTNFVGANSKLRACRDVYQNFINKDIFPYLAQRGIKWHFNPPSSPHFGGLWEAGVKSVKYHLKRTIGEQKLTFEEFSTVLTQIESCLNSRPLCPLTNDPDDLMVLTPGHFLIGDALFALPEMESKNMKLLDRWHHCQTLVRQFWRQWQNEYLSRLQRRPKWLSKSQNLKVNDMGLIKDERYPSSRWPLARIVELHPGEDGVVRVVTLKTGNGLIKRPVVKVCLLPTQDNFDSIEFSRHNNANST